MKEFDSIITLNAMLMDSTTVTTVAEVKEIILDSAVELFGIVLTLKDI